MAGPAEAHDHWSSRLVFLLAAIGAAVGIGNIWKFPYLAGANGGSAFVLVYLLCVTLVVLPILVGEIALGRMGGLSPPRSMRALAGRFGRGRIWIAAGGLGILSAYLIASYYSVIAGWTLNYVIKAAGGDFTGQDAAAIAAQFDAVLADPAWMTGYHAVFMLVTGFVLAHRLQTGLERAMRVLMPLLAAILLLLLGYSAIAGDMRGALSYLFAFELSAIDGEVVLTALGQAFFSVGVAMGLMLGFGAYLDRDVDVGRSAVIIALADTGVALLAGIAIFPIVFANGLDPAEGPGLVFVSLPIAFGQMPGGLGFGTLFFLLLFVAALTSAIGVLEPVVAWVREASGLSRRRSATLVCSTIFVLGLGTVFSFNLWAGWHPLGFLERFEDATVFNLVDYVTISVLVPIAGILLALFAGWCVPVSALDSELGLRPRWVFRLWIWLLRWVAPLAIVAILLGSL